MVTLGRDPWWHSNLRPLPYADPSPVLIELLESIDRAKADINRICGAPMPQNPDRTGRWPR
jgi:hypothetical protein